MDRVIIIEDNPADAEILEENVRHFLPHAEIVLASDGDDALEHLKRGKFDVAFLDLNMPRMSGAELLQELTGLSVSLRSMPIVITTTDTESVRSVFQSQHFKLGIYLVKPLDLKEYTTSVAWVLDWIRHTRKPPKSIARAFYEHHV